MPAATKLLGVRIDRNLHRAARARAFEEDRPLSDLVRDALQQYLDAAEKGAA